MERSFEEWLTAKYPKVAEKYRAGHATDEFAIAADAYIAGKHARDAEVAARQDVDDRNDYGELPPSMRKRR